jgi:hypothetical protein
MKNLALLTLLITMALTSFGQSQRLVMLEHFTQASCGPCATVNPTIHNLMLNNADKMTTINYHTSWPGYDPMYLHNTADPSARVSYYGVNSVPHSVIDGNVYSGHPNGWTSNMSIINDRYAVPSPFTLSVNQHLSALNDTLFVTMLVEATAPVTGPITAFMGIIEKHIHYNTPPGSNGERDFYNVLKKMLPAKTGIALPTPMQPGEYVILEYYWVVANVYNLDQLSVVSFIQNPTSKEIYQAANLMIDPIQAVYNNDVESMIITNALPRYCQESLSPKIEIRNNGNNDLTSLTIKYQVNDEDIHTYQWTGSMDFLDHAILQLPEITYSIQDTNVLIVYIDQVNLTNDEYTKNDTLVHQFESALLVSNQLQLKIRTDNAPEEVTWEIFNWLGEVVASGGPYTEANTMHTENITLPAGDDAECFEFFIYDSGNNGLCCGNGTGLFRLAPASGNPVIAQGTIFESVVGAQFLAFTVGINELDTSTEPMVYPNPAGNSLWIEVATNSSNITITNQLGQIVFEKANASGKMEINTTPWPNGLYIVNIRSERGVSIKKINVIK